MEKKNVGESSKKAKARAKLQRNALIAAIRGRRAQGIIISNNPSNESNTQDSEHGIQKETVDKKGKKKVGNTSLIEEDEFQESDSLKEKEKKKRGPTRMGMISNRNPRLIVEYNERGQPISENSQKLSSYLGVTVREYVPISCKGWDQVDLKVKEELWSLVQQRFVIDECYKKLTLRAMGKSLRQYKSRLTKQIRDVKRKKDKSASDIRPTNVDPENWKEFMKDRLSKEFEVKSNKFKKMRTDQKIIHTMSRKGYARLEHEMRTESSNQSSITRVDVWTRGHTRKDGEPINQEVGDTLKKLQECSQSMLSPCEKGKVRQDALTQVLGPEQRGCVRGLGFGVTPKH